MTISSAPTQNSKHRTCVIFVVHDSLSIASLISYLGRRGTQVWTVNNLQEAAARLTTQRVDVIFLSCNLKSMNHKEAGEILTSNFKVPCVHFNETGSKRHEALLRGIDVPLKSFLPNTGMKIATFIDSIINDPVYSGENQGPAGKSHVPVSLLPVQTFPIESKFIPAEGRWLQLDDEERMEPPFTFKLILPKNTARAVTSYYYVGSKLPSFDREQKLWHASTPEGVFYHDKIPAADELGEDPFLGKSPKKYGTFSFDESKHQSPALVDTPVQPERTPLKKSSLVTASRATQSLFEECLQDALTVITKAAMNDGETSIATQSTRFSVIVVKTAKTEGYLITPIGSEAVQEYTIFSELHDCLKAKLAEYGEEMEKVSPPLLFETDPFDFLPWAETKKNFLLTSKILGAKFSCMFLKAPISYILVDARPADMTPIPVNSLNYEVALTFDLFLALPKNEKFLLYRRAEHKLPAGTLEKFDRFNIPNLFMRTAEIHRFYAYCAATTLYKHRKVSGY